MSEKCCTKCGEDKPLGDYYKSKNTKDGHYTYCKKCINEINKKWRQANREYVNELNRKYYKENPDKVQAWKKPKSSKVIKKAKQNFRAKYPSGHTAQRRVQNAVAAGKLIKPQKCEVCLEERPLQGHHEDYSKPLDVQWLCSRCHKRLHSGLLGKEI